MTTGTWEPVLDGPAAAAAWEAIRDVARAIAEGQGSRRRAGDIALFWAYVAGAIEEDWVSQCYDDATEQLGSAIEQHGSFLGLHGGLAGTGFVIAHISEPGAAEDVLAEIDRALGRALATERWEADYDLIGGLVGYGVYFLERGDAPEAEAGLARVLAHLEANREQTPEGATWHTPQALLPPWQRAQAPGGYYNCGLAHGVPGVIALLGRASVADPCREALRWLAAQQTTSGSFPSWITVPAGPPDVARTAWCYGDPGIAIAAWGASARLGLPIDRWRELALAAAGRPFELSGVRDAGLCHGAAGLAHIYNRCYQASREPALREAARGWFERALAMRRPDGVGGFAAWTGDDKHNIGWQPAADLVEGAIGVALALLAAVHPTEPAWDRLFQCDLPLAAGL